MPDIAKINAVAIADIEKVDGILAANIEKVNGLTFPTGVVDAYTFKIDTSLGDGTPTFQLPLSGTTNIEVFWGDGSSDIITSSSAAAKDHTYSTGGVYTIYYTGTTVAANQNTTPDTAKYTDILKWSSNYVGGNFSGCTGLTTLSATDSPNSSSFNTFFFNCSNLVAGFENWDTSSVTAMATMFRGTAITTNDLSSWDTSSVTNMQQMFRDTSFNGDVTTWDTGLCANFYSMFRNASNFNQDVSGWDTSSATRMDWMFGQANSFDQNLGSWNIGLVTVCGNMITNNISTSNYDALLIGWAAQAPNIQTGVSLSTGPQYSSAAVSARNVLTSTYSWTISDGGQAP